MAAIILTNVKIDNNTAWLTTDTADKGVFTDEQYTQNILPFINLIKSTPGFQDISVSITDLTKVTTINYDNGNNANTSFKFLFGPTSNIEALSYKALITSKISELNLSNSFILTLTTVAS